MEHINQRWAAPEILEGRNYSVNSDVYSMGLVFWETRYRKIAYHDVCPYFLILILILDLIWWEGIVFVLISSFRFEIFYINLKWKYARE